jgi:hypothetical protein
MKFLIIFCALFVSSLAETEQQRCPNCTVAVTSEDCYCKAFLQTLELVNGTEVYCCGKNIQLEGFWKKLIKGIGAAVGAAGIGVGIRYRF